MDAIVVSEVEELDRLIAELGAADCDRPRPVVDSTLDLNVSAILQILDRWGLIRRNWSAPSLNGTRCGLAVEQAETILNGLERRFGKQSSSLDGEIYVDRCDHKIISGWAKPNKGELPVLLRFLFDEKHEYLIPAVGKRRALIEKSLSRHGHHNFRLDLSELGIVGFGVCQFLFYAAHTSVIREAKNR